VPGVNISRSEANERSSHIAVESYEVHIDVTQGNENFLATSTVNFTCNTPGYNTFIDAVGKRIISATLNGESVDTSSYDGETLFINNLQANNTLTVEIEGNYSKDGEGLQLSIDPADNEVYLYSQGETAYIRKMYPCFDQPDLKATFSFTVIAPEHWKVISNAPVKSQTSMGNAKSKWEFDKTLRISTYVTALVAGPYYSVSDEYVSSLSGKKIPLGIYCRNSLSTFLDPEDIFLLTKQGFDYFEKVFGLAYPFEKYDQIAVVDFNWGAMENVGAVTFRESLLVFRSKVTDRMYSARADVILHEMAHMWFGNMVTMKWWDDLWLNESFAEWSSYLALAEGTRFVNGWTGFNSERKNWAYRQDQLSSTHPIISDMVDIEAVNANFDGITYAKGASVLQQLVAHVGRDNFIEGLKKYFAKHAFKNTTLDDLLGELEIASGRKLAPWVATWLQTAGVNTLRPQVEFAGDSYASISIDQSAPLVPAGSTELRPHRIAIGLYDLENGKVQLRKRHEFDLAGKTTHLPELSGEKKADLLLINDGDMSYAKLRLDPTSIETLKSHLGDITDPLTRALCWSTVWDMVRDAELTTRDFITIVESSLGKEDDITTVTILLTQTYTAIELYAHPTHRDALREKAGDLYVKLTNEAKPGSDHQLQFIRGVASHGISASHIEFLKKALAGEVNGLIVDTDLRWSLVNALVEKGVYGDAELKAELDRDNTFNGNLNYLYGLAGRINLESKKEVWKSITTEELTSSTREAKFKGFNCPRNREILAEFVDPYFELLIPTWGKSYEVGSKFTVEGFPIYITTPETLAKTEHWLNVTGKDAAAGLRRLVSENRDSLVRALKAQECDK
jgi:aminopeptidase N